MPYDNIRDALIDFYRKQPEIRGEPIISDLAKISDGWENEVYSFTLKHGKLSKPVHENLILRIYPGDGAPKKASREFSGMKKLHQMGFPVPEVFVLELDESYFGRPFVTMQKVDGRPMVYVYDESSEERKAELLTLCCRMFVDLHAIDWRQFDTIRPTYDTEDPYGHANYWLSYAREHINRFGLAEFDPVVDWLERRISEVPCRRLSVVHLDYHPHNILIRDDGRAFVIDWTNIIIADYRMDLAWTILLMSTYGNPESRELFLDEYERIAGKEVEQIEYFDVVASLRRLLSIAISLSAGSDRLGMRPEAIMQMRQRADHIANVYEFMRERIDTDISKVADRMSALLDH